MNLIFLYFFPFIVMLHKQFETGIEKIDSQNAEVDVNDRVMDTADGILFTYYRA